MRFLATLPKCIPEPLMVRDRDRRPQEDPLAVHCFCVCSGSALLGDLLGLSRSMKRVFLSVLFYPRVFFSFYCTVSSFIRDILHVSIMWHIFLRVHCVHLVARWSARKTLLRKPISRGEYPHKDQAEGHFYVLWRFDLLFYCPFVPGPKQYFIHPSMARYSLCELKVP